MWDLILGLLAFMVLQHTLVVVYQHWVDALKSVQVSIRSGAVPRDHRRLIGWMTLALCLSVVGGRLYFGLLLRLQTVIQSAIDHPVETVFWFVITWVISIAALVDLIFCSVWILQVIKYLLNMVVLSLWTLCYSAARNGTTIYRNLESGDLTSAPHSYRGETSPLLVRAAEGSSNLPAVAMSQDRDPNDPITLAWVSRDEMIRKAIANAIRSPVATPPLVSPRSTSPPEPTLEAPLFRSSTTPTPPSPSTSSSGSDFGPCYVDSEFSEVTSEASSKSAASAKSQPEFTRELFDDYEEELTILEQTMTL